MRDFSDAKAMAQSLREALSVKRISITHSEALELVSTVLGFADWNTLSAFINKRRGSLTQESALNVSQNVFPVIPMKDLVPFPGMRAIPLFVKRDKTVQAVTKAFAKRRELVVVAQKSSVVEELGGADVYDVGVIGRVLDVGPPSAKSVSLSPMLEGSIRVLVQMQGRVSIRNFTSESGLYEAEVDYLDEGIPSASPRLIGEAATRFDRYGMERGINVGGLGVQLCQLHDPGRVADIIASSLFVTIEKKQRLLATLDPIARLESVIAEMAA